jgi:hypothetical protein
VGTLLGGASVAVGLWLPSGIAEALPYRARVVVVLAAVVVATARDLGFVDLPLPERTTLVPRTVFDGGLARGGLWFGFELGLGFRTRLPSTIPYALALAVLLGIPDLLQLGALAVGFAAGRSLSALGRTISRDGQRWDAAVAASAASITKWASLAGAVALVAATVAMTPS